jgi:hypothetical protein
MRAIILAALIAVGVGLAFTPTVNAAPASGVSIGESAGHSNVTKVQHWRWGSRRAWRRCHSRGWSRMYRC